MDRYRQFVEVITDISEVTGIYLQFYQVNITDSLFSLHNRCYPGDISAEVTPICPSLCLSNSSFLFLSLSYFIVFQLYVSNSIQLANMSSSFFLLLVIFLLSLLSSFPTYSCHSYKPVTILSPEDHHDENHNDMDYAHIQYADDVIEATYAEEEHTPQLLTPGQFAEYFQQIQSEQQQAQAQDGKDEVSHNNSCYE